MDTVLDNLFILTLTSVSLFNGLIGYIKVKRSGPIMSRHKHRNLSKRDVIGIVFILMLFIYFQITIVSRNMEAIYFIFIFLAVITFLNTIPILTTNQGFYYAGSFIKWEKIVDVSMKKEGVLKLRRLTMIYSDIKIREMEDQDYFLSLLKDKRNLTL